MIVTPEIRALHALLDDPAAPVREAVRARLLALGDEVIAALRAVDAEGARSVPGLDEVIGELRLAHALARMQPVAAAGDEGIDLEEAVYGIMRFGYPDADPLRCRALLDEIATDARVLAGSHAPVVERFMKLRAFVFNDLGFTGNRGDYYDPDNTYFNKVLEHRRGIPITLSVLLMLVGARLSLPLVGIGMPMHFLLRYDDGVRSFYVDAFNNGIILTEDQCRTMIKSSGVPFSTDMLRAVGHREIIERMWRNLYLAQQQQGGDDEAARVARVIALINPDFRINAPQGDDTDEATTDDDDE